MKSGDVMFAATEPANILQSPICVFCCEAPDASAKRVTSDDMVRMRVEILLVNVFYPANVKFNNAER